MITKILHEKIKRLEEEVGLLYSFTIGHIGKDAEGEYNPVFVKRALEAAKEEPRYEFKDSVSFLKHIGSRT